MNQNIAIFASVLSACSPQIETITHERLFGVAIGQPLPEEYSGHGANVGAFTFLVIPVGYAPLRTELQSVNLFTDSASGVVVGFRGDRPFPSQTECDESAKRIKSILNSAYPVTYLGSDSRYQFRSKNGDILAGVICAAHEPFVTLSLEVTNPILEDRLMKRLRNEH